MHFISRDKIKEIDLLALEMEINEDFSRGEDTKRLFWWARVKIQKRFVLTQLANLI